MDVRGHFLRFSQVRLYKFYQKPQYPQKNFKQVRKNCPKRTPLMHNISLTSVPFSLSNANEAGKLSSPVTVEKIVVMGLQFYPSDVHLFNNGE